MKNTNHKKKHSKKKVNWLVICATVLAVCLLFSALFPLIMSIPRTPKVSSGYVFINSDFKIELETDTKDIVTAYRSFNHEAALLLFREGLVGCTLSEACTRILTMADELDFFEGESVSVKVLAVNANQKHENLMLETATSALNAFFAKNEINASVLPYETSKGLAEALYITTGKYALVAEACKQETSFTPEILAYASVKVLNEFIELYDGAALGLYLGILQDELDEIESIKPKREALDALEKEKTESFAEIDTVLSIAKLIVEGETEMQAAFEDALSTCRFDTPETLKNDPTSAITFFEELKTTEQKKFDLALEALTVEYDKVVQPEILAFKQEQKKILLEEEK